MTLSSLQRTSQPFRHFLLALTVAVLLFLAATLTLQAQGTGTLSGRVVNETAGGGPGANIPVLLKVYKGMAPQRTVEAQTDTSGEFLFNGLDTAKEYIYRVIARYQGLAYPSDVMTFETGQVLTTTVPIYETTHDGGQVHVERAHLIMNVNPRRLQIGQFYVFSNPGDRTYLGSSSGVSETLRFYLPPGASDLQFQDGQLGERYFSTPDGFIDTEPVLPGTGSHQVLYSYNLDFNSPQYTFSVTTPYSVTAMNVLISDPAVRAKSPILASEGTRSLQGQEWSSLVAESLPPTQVVPLALDNLPLEARATPSAAPQAQPAQPPVDRTDMLRLIIVGVIALICGVLIGYYLPHPSAQQPTNQKPVAPKPPVEEKSEDELLAALADLDDAFERGDLTEDQYRKQRAGLKQELAARLQQGK